MKYELVDADGQNIELSERISKILYIEDDIILINTDMTGEQLQDLVDAEMLTSL